VLAEADDQDVIVCQVTSRPYASKRHVRIAPGSFARGSLPLVSYARPEKLFTASRASLGKPVAGVDESTLEEALGIARKLFGARSS
jgi:mRNA interferase MazF